MGLDPHEFCKIYFTVLESVYDVFFVNCSRKRRSSSDQDQHSFQKERFFEGFRDNFLNHPVIDKTSVPNHTKNPLAQKYSSKKSGSWRKCRWFTIKFFQWSNC
jgi:hypothetical protein